MLSFLPGSVCSVIFALNLLPVSKSVSVMKNLWEYCGQERHRLTGSHVAISPLLLPRDVDSLSCFVRLWLFSFKELSSY